MQIRGATYTFHLEISASSWFYYKEICYEAARSHEREILVYFNRSFTIRVFNATFADGLFKPLHMMCNVINTR
jgi:hypothetical protein